MHDRSVEIQLRTREQHLWAELSEKLADTVDPALKYGGGPENTLQELMAYSELLSKVENFELADATLHQREQIAAWKKELAALLIDYYNDVASN